jgi:hypothetical protein
MEAPRLRSNVVAATIWIFVFWCMRACQCPE